MKNMIKWFALVLLLVGIIGGATLLYNNLSREYGGENISENEYNEETQNDFMAAPDFTVLDYDLNEVNLSDYMGKPIVLNFWATWCYYCKVEMPDFDKARENYPDVQFLMVNATDGAQETVESAKAYIEKEGYGFDVFFDTNLEAVSAYYVTGFPATFFINKDGALVARGSGMLDYESLEKGIKMISGVGETID